MHSGPEIAEISQMLLLSVADTIIAVGMVSFLPDGMFTLSQILATESIHSILTT